MQQNILELTKKLLIIPSEKGNSNAMEEVINAAITDLKDYPQKNFLKNGSPSVLISNTDELKNFKIILNAHLDVVHAKNNQYDPVEKDGKLYGRGTNDMKAAAAAMIIAFKELAHKVTYPLGLQLVTDEEVGGFDGTKYQVDEGVRADFVIAGEPTNMDINNKAKGILWLKIKTHGKVAHGAYPWQGENAIKAMQYILEIIEREFPVPQEESWVTTVNVAKIETSNQTFNQVPEDCTLSLDVRYIPEEKDTILEKIKSLVPKEASIEVVLNEPAQFTDENNSYILTLQKTIEEITTKPAKTIVKHGGADIRHFNQVGCDGITFGPIGAGLHSDEEWVDLQSLNQYYEVVKKFLLTI